MNTRTPKCESSRAVVADGLEHLALKSVIRALRIGFTCVHVRRLGLQVTSSFDAKIQVSTRVMEKFDNLERLRQDPGPHLWAIQDLSRFPEKTQLFAINEEDPASFAYLLVSGHPSISSHGPTLILGGNALSSRDLLSKLPKPPFLIRETPASFLPILQPELPSSAQIFLEQRMELKRESYRPMHDDRARRLIDADAEALAAFHGAPPQAARGFMNWIRGARALLGIFDGPNLVAIGSSFCSTPEGWTLVSIETKKEHRRKGLGLQITSKLCEIAFSQTSLVSLTVVRDNLPAIKLYEKLGFQACENRVWIDCGVGAKP